ncbi:DinB family protein [uncultured Imperialibacter sp.]|uniref:DinB family protein n=1 Tax=uncultured Imperialibacter sp. TaxID=1672639 RepID=UPI0030D80FEB|tara:strand:- start:150663 stop:151202 length:540 start_codon:yes stop_codon:yes gene_type:complete
MNRKESLTKIAAGAGLLTALPLATWGRSHTADFTSDFLPRWETSKGYTLKVLDKMPEEHFNYAPTAEQMGFGKQLTHMAFWNSFYIAPFEGKQAMPEPKEITKATARAYIEENFDYCTSVIKKISSADLNRKSVIDENYWREHTGRDLLLRAFAHTSHHRAEAIVYLRLKGIEPPFFEF